MLHKSISSLGEILKKLDGWHPDLEHIQVKKNGERIEAYATDGKIAGILEYPADMLNPEDYPQELHPAEWKEVYLTEPAVRKLSKSLPKFSPFPLNSTLGVPVEDSEEETKIRALDKDFDAVEVTCKKPSSYPDIRKVIPTKEPVFSIRISVEILEKLVKTVKKFSSSKNPYLEFEFMGEEEIMKIVPEQNDEVSLMFVAMPVKKS